jgi:hypothetical protein
MSATGWLTPWPWSRWRRRLPLGAGVADATLLPVLPVLLPMVTAVVGVRVVLDSIQLVPSITGLTALFGSGSLWFNVVLMGRGGSSADRPSCSPSDASAGVTAT